jgi:hypothetical protein
MIQPCVTSINTNILRNLDKGPFEDFQDLLGMANWIGKSKKYVAEFEEQIQTFVKRVEATCYGRRFILTDNGTMGLASGKTEIGDLIVFFNGGLYPFVIRDQGHGTFALIRDCFHYDISEGHELKKMSESKTKQYIIS